MANISGTLAPAEQDGTTFTVTSGATSGNKTFWPNAILLIAVAGAANTGAVVTFGQVNAGPLGGTGHAPTTPTLTNGFFINANAPAQAFWLGPQRDTINFFASGGNITVSIQPLSPV